MARTKITTPHLEPNDVRDALAKLLRVAITWERKRAKTGRRNVRDAARLLEAVLEEVNEFSRTETLLETKKVVVTQLDREVALPIWRELQDLISTERSRRQGAVKTKGVVPHVPFPKAALNVFDRNGWKGTETQRAKIEKLAKTLVTDERGAMRTDELAATLTNAARLGSRSTLHAKASAEQRASIVHRMSFVHDEDMIIYLLVILGTSLRGARKIAGDLWNDPRVAELARAADEKRADYVKLGAKIVDDKHFEQRDTKAPARDHETGRGAVHRRSKFR